MTRLPSDVRGSTDASLSMKSRSPTKPPSPPPSNPKHAEETAESKGDEQVQPSTPSVKKASSPKGSIRTPSTLAGNDTTIVASTQPQAPTTDARSLVRDSFAFLSVKFWADSDPTDN